LAGLGADVVKIEPAAGAPSRAIGPFLGDVVDPERSLHLWAYNRGKKSVILDLDGAEDRDRFELLLGSADVLLDSTPKGSLAFHGWHGDELHERYPGLVHARISPFGDEGPWANYKSSDLVHLALGGPVMNCGYDPDPFGNYDVPPVAPQLWHSYHIAGEQTAIGIVAALLYRQRTGRGQLVSVAIHQAVSTNTEIDLMSWVMTRQSLGRQTCRHAHAQPSDPSIVYTKDGRWMLAITVGMRDRKQLVPFFAKYQMASDLSVEEGEDEVGFRPIPGSTSAATSSLDIIQRFARRFRYEDVPWTGAQEAGLLWSPIRKPHENAIDEHWLSRGTFSNVEHPELGRTLPYPASKWLSTRGSWRPGRRAPLLGEDREAVLASSSPPSFTVQPSPGPEVLSAHQKPFPLQGVRILDFGWFLASAGATRFLAALGADVLKVEWKTHPDSGRGALVPEGGREARRAATSPVPTVSDRTIGGQFNNKNPGKRGLSLNVAHPEGLKLAKDLIAHCDVVAEGFSPGVLERWGLGYEDQKAIKSDIIYVKQSGMGAFGTYGRFRAVGPIAGALSGIAEMSGFPEPYPPAGWGYSYLDWFGAYSMALAITTALLHRDRTGEGQWIDASQTEVGIALTGVPVLDWAANGRTWKRYGNRSPYKLAAPQGIYRCSGHDRWIALTCLEDREWRALATLAGHDDWVRDPRFATAAGRMEHHDALDQLIESWTITREPYDTMSALQAAGVPAGVCQTAQDRCDHDPQLKYLGWLTELTGTKIGTWPLAEVPIKMSETPPYCGGWIDRAAPLYGEDNREILSGLLGLSESDIDSLAEQGVI
jgi:crotonobetainyl-CoA:carnitine CoA-transferase CaiB-like acyl-CoA transferase